MGVFRETPKDWDEWKGIGDETRLNFQQLVNNLIGTDWFPESDRYLLGGCSKRVRLQLAARALTSAAWKDSVASNGVAEPGAVATGSALQCRDRFLVKG